MKRIAYKKEPILHAHKYIILVINTKMKYRNSKYHYCVNLKEVNQVKKSAPAKSVVEVYKAEHNFREAWIK